MDTERPWRATAGGVLSVIAGSIHLLGWLAVAVLLRRLAREGALDESGPLGSGLAVWFLVLPLLVAAAVAVAGGICALKRRCWGFALAGAICSILSPLTWIAGFAATVFISISRHEFGAK